MLNKSSALPGTARLKAILEDPDTILQIENPTEKMQLAAVQKKPELIGHLPFATEKVQLSAVITSAESIFLIHNRFTDSLFRRYGRDIGTKSFPRPDSTGSGKRTGAADAERQSRGKVEYSSH